MSESLKFGPEWLRNTIATSPVKHDDIICRPILSDFRYSREEMLSLCDSSSQQPEFFFSKMFHNTWQLPLGFISEDSNERDKSHPSPSAVHNQSTSRLFLNSNIKQGAWRKNCSSDGEKVAENWRNQKDSNTTSNGGVFFNNTYNEQRRHISWRKRENTVENLFQQQQKPSPSYSKHLDSLIQKSPSPPFQSPTIINAPYKSPVSNEVTDLSRSYYSDENVSIPTNGLSNRECVSSSSQITKNRNPETERFSHSTENIRQFEMELLKNFTDLIISSERDAAIQNHQMPIPPHLANQQIPPMISMAQAQPQFSVVNNVQEKNPIMWFFIDAYGTVRGPFDEMAMSNWYKERLFYDNLLVKRSIDVNFISLRHLIKIYGSAHPFTAASNHANPIPEVENYFDEFHPSNNHSHSHNHPAYDNGSSRLSSTIQQNHRQTAFIQQPFMMNQQQQHFDPRMMSINNLGIISPSAHSPVAKNFPMDFLPQPPVQSPSKPSFGMNQFHGTFPMHENTIPIQKILFDIQKQHEIQLIQQQKKIMNMQQSSIQSPLSTTVPDKNTVKDFQNDNATVSTNEVVVPTAKRRSLKKNEKDGANFDADDEDDFRKVENSRKKRFQKETIEKTESIKATPAQSSSNVSTPKIAQQPPTVELKRTEERTIFSRPSTSVQWTNKENLSQSAAPAPWFDKVVTNENDGKGAKKIQFTCSEERSTNPTTPAPWLNAVVANQSDDNKSLKKIQIEEEEVRQNELQIKRENEKRQQELQKRQELNKSKWKEVVVEGGSAGADRAVNIWTFAPSPKKIVKKKGKKMIAIETMVELEKSEEPPQVEVHENDDGKHLKNWCVETLQGMNITHIDIRAFANFLHLIESPFELEDYIKDFLGDTMQSNGFLMKYLKQRSKLRNIFSKKQQTDDDLCAPAKAINDEMHKTANKKKALSSKEQGKKSRKMKVVDANILGFKGAPDSNRIPGEVFNHHSDD